MSSIKRMAEELEEMRRDPETRQLDIELELVSPITQGTISNDPEEEVDPESIDSKFDTVEDAITDIQFACLCYDWWSAMIDQNWEDVQDVIRDKCIAYITFFEVYTEERYKLKEPEIWIQFVTVCQMLKVGIDCGQEEYFNDAVRYMSRIFEKYIRIQY